MIFLSGLVMPPISSNVWYKLPGITKQSCHNFKMYGCKIQNLKVGWVPITVAELQVKYLTPTFPKFLTL